jgi:hypothetical protein
MKLVRLIKMYLNKMYGKVHIGKHLSDNLPIQNGWLTFIGLCGVISQKIVHFIVTAVRTSNPTFVAWHSLT